MARDAGKDVQDCKASGKPNHKPQRFVLSPGRKAVTQKSITTLRHSIMADNMESPQTLKVPCPTQQAVPLLGIHPKEIKSAYEKLSPYLSLLSSQYLRYGINPDASQLMIE